MELWQDSVSNKYFLLDQSTGQQTKCDKFGQKPVTFKPYSSGFSRQLGNLSPAYQFQYSVQPSKKQAEKFDGYFQCPRPLSSPYFNYQHDPKFLRPYKPGKMPSNRLPDDLQKIPRPIQHLSFSRVYDSNTRPPKIRAVQTPVHTEEPFFHTIKDIKQSQITVPGVQLKTATDLSKKFSQQKANLQGYQPPIKPDPRRQLQGYFMLNYPTSGDLFKKEKALMAMTNPTALTKQLYYEELDRKNLERRREQRVLKNRAAGL